MLLHFVPTSPSLLLLLPLIQGTCWSSRRAVSPLSSSQDSTGEGGWDPKPRLQDSLLWSMRVVKKCTVTVTGCD